jgi:hypothetical protein
MGYHPSGLLIADSTNYVFPRMQDEQANEGRREKKVVEQDSDIATTAAKRTHTHAHVNEAPDPPRPQKRVRNGVLVDRTRQVTPAERQTQHKTNTDMNSDFMVLIQQDDFEKNTNSKATKDS